MLVDAKYVADRIRNLEEKYRDSSSGREIPDLWKLKRDLRMLALEFEIGDLKYPTPPNVKVINNMIS